MKDKKKAVEEVQRLVNTNFTDKNIKIKISYEKEDSKKRGNSDENKRSVKKGGMNMAAVDRRKETVNRKAEDAREFVELLEQMTEADKERIKYVMIGLKMGETVRTGLTA